MLMEFKRKIIIKLRSVLFEESTNTRQQKENPYDVAFVEPMHNHDRSPEKLLCELRDTMSVRLKVRAFPIGKEVFKKRKSWAPFLKTLPTPHFLER